MGGCGKKAQEIMVDMCFVKEEAERIKNLSVDCYAPSEYVAALSIFEEAGKEFKNQNEKMFLLRNYDRTDSLIRISLRIFDTVSNIIAQGAIRKKELIDKANSFKTSISNVKKKASKQKLTELVRIEKEMFTLYDRYMENCDLGAAEVVLSDAFSAYNKIIEEENKIIKEKEFQKDWKIIGKWYGNMGSGLYCSFRLLYSKKTGEYFMDRNYDDGSNDSQKLGKLGSKYMQFNSFGEYYMINSFGNLELYDRDGLIATIH